MHQKIKLVWPYLCVLKAYNAPMGMIYKLMVWLQCVNGPSSHNKRQHNLVSTANKQTIKSTWKSQSSRLGQTSFNIKSPLYLAINRYRFLIHGWLANSMFIFTHVCSAETNRHNTQDMPPLHPHTSKFSCTFPRQKELFLHPKMIGNEALPHTDAKVM